jgi:predicted nucleic acid-binding protein
MNPALLDYDILMAFFNGNNKAHEALKLLSDKYDMACSVVTISEIFGVGKLDPLKRKAIESFFDHLIVIDIDKEIAMKAANVYGEFNRFKVDFNSCFIAATACALRYPIITGNKKRYPMKDISLEIVTI